MQENGLRLNVSTLGDATVAVLTDRRILDEVSITQISGQLNDLIANVARPKIVLDFTNVAQMSSSALGMLITLHKRIREKDGELRLCNVQPSIYEVFVITRLNEIFQLSQSRQEALESLH